MKKISPVIMVAALACVGCGKSSDKDSKSDDDKSIVDKARGTAEDLGDKARGAADDLGDKARGAADDLGDKARGAADDLGDAARDRAGDLADRARGGKLALERKAGEHVGDVKDRIGGILGRAETTGADAAELLRPYAEKSRGHAANLIVDGKQQAGKAAAIAAALAPKVAEGVGIRPIYVEVGDGGDSAAIDAAIGRMPRVEVIDGLTVGFRALGKRQVLVAYRRGDHLVGFVYTSLTDMLIAHVVDQAPRLLPLVELAVD